MRVKIRNKIWNLIVGCKLPAGTDGHCDDPSEAGRSIRVRWGLSGPLLLDTICHEVLHATIWDLGDGPVDSLATTIAHQLWAQGLRPKQHPHRAMRRRLECAIVGLIWTRGELAAIDELVRREVARSIAKVLTKLGWGFADLAGSAA